MVKTLMIDNKAVEFKSSAAVPRMYRLKYNRDIFRDMKKLAEEMEANREEASAIAIGSLEMFENIAWVMAKHADPAVPDVEDWLAEFETFSIYGILPELLDMWQTENLSLAEPKKK